MAGVIQRARDEGVRQGRVEGMRQGRVEGVRQGRVKGVRQGRVEGVRQGRVEGEQRGLVEGERTVLERQLRRRFGLLPTQVNERLRGASTAELETWAENVLDAETLDEVFEPRV